MTKAANLDRVEAAVIRLESARPSELAAVIHDMALVSVRHALRELVGAGRVSRVGAPGRFHYQPGRAPAR